MKTYMWAFVLGINGTATAPVNAGCVDIGIKYLQRSAAEVREMAERCDEPALADLYFKRAYHLELLQRNTASTGKLITYGGRSSSLREYRLYIAMLEGLAPHWLPDRASRTEFLRGEYDHRGEVVELRLRGFDRLADRLERKRRMVH